ncbi:hypothetical protein DIPPA_30674 [Diplonema papillatum]|nr:hypothetical protein DIPPA_30674 [Diplonema papillatum]
MQHRGVLRATVATLDPKRKVLKGFPTEEVLNQYNPAIPPIGRRPYGDVGHDKIEQYRLRFRQKLSNDELNPIHTSNWRKYELSPKENRHNPDSFHYEQYKHGGQAYQEVFIEDVQRLTEFPEKGVCVVDVRADFELVARHLPFSIRIPFDEVGYALQLSGEQFFEMYGFHPPERGAEIVCVSHEGVASEKALKEFEKWGYPADTLFNFRGGTNALHRENHSDWGGNAAEEEITPDSVKGDFPVTRPDYLAQVGPHNPKYYPYPAESLDEQTRRDETGTWTVTTHADASNPTGKHMRKRREYAQLVDGQWLRARFVSDIKWYDFSHRESLFRWREPDLSFDRAFRPTGFRFNQFWRNVPA